MTLTLYFSGSSSIRSILGEGSFHIRELKQLGVFETRSSTGSQLFCLLIRLESFDATKLVLLSVFTGCYRDDLPENKGRTTAQECERLLPVAVRRSITSLLKPPIISPIPYQLMPKK